MTQPKPQDPPIEPVSGDELRRKVAALARAHPRVMEGERELAHWQRLYLDVIDAGARIDKEGA